MTPLVSICMVCRDRWELTSQALESLLRNTPQEAYRLTIVDDASRIPLDTIPEAPWASAADSVLAYPSSLLCNHEPLGVGGSKNLAMASAGSWIVKGPYLFSCDNDIRFKPGWLETLIGAYEAAKGDYKLLGGYAHPFNGTNHRHTYGDYEIHEKNAVDGLSWFMEWETWHKYGPLDSHARGVRQSEDWAFCQKIRNDGFKVGVVYPHVIENHGVVDTFGEKIPGAELVEAELAK